MLHLRQKISKVPVNLIKPKEQVSYYHLMIADSSYAWVRADGCRYPGACPRNPLQGGALPIAADFDFGGREELLIKDLVWKLK